MTLKKCPFCGGDADKRNTKIAYETWHWIVCQSCNGRTGLHIKREEAIKAWNRRAESEPFSPEWLKSRREAMGITKNELGRRIGASSTAIRKWEAGIYKPKEDVKKRLLEVLE